MTQARSRNCSRGRPVIYADDQSTRTVGCYPESWGWVKTPHIDALAKSGVRFTGAYLGAWCMPSRASLLTGRFPHGIQSMRMEGKYPASTYDPKRCPFWPAAFRASGYHTAHIGKWHTGTDAGFGRDWDHQIVWNRPQYPENAGAYYTKQLLQVNGKEEWHDGYPADNYTKWAVDYITGAGRDKDKPWFLWLCHGSIHGPSIPAARHKGMYKDGKVTPPADVLGPWPGKPDYLKDTLAWRKEPDGAIHAGPSGEKFGDVGQDKKGIEYAAWVRQMNECVPAIDEGVGELVQALKKSGQLENTLVVYTADQGFAMGEHGMRMKIAPYEPNFRSPLIVSWPGVTPAGKVCKERATAPDLVATFFAAAGVAPPKGEHALHGRDLTPLLKNPAAGWGHPCLYEHTGDNYGDAVAEQISADPNQAIYQKVPWYTAVIQDGWKYIRYLQPRVPEELYDLATDPDEMKNRAADAKHAAKLEAMREVLSAELKRTRAQPALLPDAAPKRKTAVGIEKDRFYINGQPTYKGRNWNDRPVEGLLMNSRMVQATFDDRNPETAARWAYPDTKKWDADRNTAEFIEMMPTWRKHGLLAVTLNLQGGSPEGYSKAQPWHNSAVNADGTLDEKYMRRLAKVIDKADELGMVVVLGLYYFGQDERVKDEKAVIAGVDAAVDWLVARKYTNVLVEVNNECNVKAYDHDILKPERVHELIERVKKRSAEKKHPLLAGTSYGGGAIPKPNVVKASDFLLLHGNGVKEPKRITEMVQQTRKVDGYRPMPILFNEDDHFNFDKPENNFVAAVTEYASWGYFDFRMKGEGFDEGFQSVPVNWKTSSGRKKGFFKLLSEITGEKP